MALKTNHLRNAILAMLFLILGASCQHLKDQPVPDPLHAPELGQLETYLSDSGTGVLPQPDSSALAGGSAMLTYGQPRYGLILPDRNGKLYYRAGPRFLHSDSASYSICRGGTCSSGLLIIRIRPNACLPYAVADSFSINQPGPTVLDVLANDIRCPLLSLNLTTETTNTFPYPNVQLINNTRIVYTPPPNFSGKEIFSYSITNRGGVTRKANVILQVVTPSSPCLTPFQAHSDTLSPYRFPVVGYRYNIASLLSNDAACPDSLDPTSFDIVPGSATLGLNIRIDRSAGLAEIVCDVRDPNLQFISFQYQIRTHNRRHQSRAMVYLYNR
jgi:hypothetical protein